MCGGWDRWPTENCFSTEFEFCLFLLLKGSIITATRAFAQYRTLINEENKTFILYRSISLKTVHPWGILICILQNKNNKLELSDKIHKRFAIGPTHAYLNLLLNQSSHIKINIILFFTQLEMHFGTQMQTVIAQRQQRITNPCPANAQP